MKNVNMFKLAKVISEDIEIFGLRPGEKLNETLVSKKELPYTRVKNSKILIFDKIQEGETLKEEHSSLTAENMSTKEMESLIR